MEATKKKKAYLKPEMSRFEVKTQEFIAGSKEIIEIPPTTEDNEIIDFTSALGPECTKGGTYSQIVAGGCETFKINSLQKEDKCSIWPILIKEWPELTEGSTVCICHRIINGESHYYASKGACTSSTVQ